MIPVANRTGKRFNGAKLLIDPYAKALSHKTPNRDNLLLAYDATSADRDLSLDTRDNSHLVPKAIVVDDAFDWRGVGPPAIPLERLIIYEVHARGFTAHPSSRVKVPGTYLTLGFFAPESGYGTGRKPGCQVAEFKTLVRKLHQAGIEVILDLVYNHTAEGNELGPTLSLPLRPRLGAGA